MANIKDIVGNHNIANTDSIAAQKSVQNCCPPGWIAIVKENNEDMPNGAVQVGKLKTRRGKFEFKDIFVYPEKSK